MVERPIRHASRALQAPESKWTTREQELLGGIWACEKWHSYCWGRKFRIQTDHANLKWLETTAPTKDRLSRWSMRLAELDYELDHKAGKDSNPPDALSRGHPWVSGQDEPEEEPACREPDEEPSLSPGDVAFLHAQWGK